MHFLLSSSLLLSLISLSFSSPIEGGSPANNDGSISLIEKEDGIKEAQSKFDNNDKEDQPLVHEEPQREFVPIQKRDTDHKPAAETEVPSMSSDVETQPKSPFDGLREDGETKVRISRRVGKKKVTPRPSRA